jgi:hypothetical protein
MLRRHETVKIAATDKKCESQPVCRMADTDQPS